MFKKNSKKRPFLLATDEETPLRVVTPYKLISHEYANIRKVYFIIAWHIYFFQNFQRQFNLFGNFLV